MRKRLRKKLHKGEFSEYGVEIVMVNKDETITTDDIDHFVDSLLDVLDSKGRQCGGGWSLKSANLVIEVGTNMAEANLAAQEFTDFLGSYKGKIGYEIEKIGIVDLWSSD